jgi:hypothetical protein
MARVRSPVLEGSGYLISILSVAILARVAWLGAASQPRLQNLIILGVALSVLGMALRWYVWTRRRRHKGHKH